MKKIYFLALAATALLSSCMSSNSGGVAYVYLMTSRETKVVNKAPIVVELQYGDKLTGPISDANLNGKFQAVPQLRVQNIKGDALSRVEYSYASRDVVTIKYTLQGITKTDSLKLDENNMAYQIFKEGKPVDYSTKFNTEGFRTKFEEYDLTVESRTYIQVDSLGEKIITYKYSNYPNVMALQQYNIIGAPYTWMSGRFGRQSAYLLSSVIRVEDGKDVTYDYKYEFDGNGFVTKEVITRDTKEFITNTYKYAMGVIGETL